MVQKPKRTGNRLRERWGSMASVQSISPDEGNAQGIEGSDMDQVKDHRGIAPTDVNHRHRCGECGKLRYKKYRLDRNMARSLKWFVDNPGWHLKTSAEVPKEMLLIKNYALLRHWGLLQAGEEKDQWRATSLATKFVYGNALIWSHIVLANRSILVGYSGHLSTFSESCGVVTSTSELESGWVS